MRCIALALLVACSSPRQGPIEVKAPEPELYVSPDFTAPDGGVFRVWTRGLPDAIRASTYALPEMCVFARPKTPGFTMAGAWPRSLPCVEWSQ